MNTLFVLPAPDGPTSPRRPIDITHNTNAVASATPKLQIYPRFVKRMALGRAANEASFWDVVSSRVASATGPAAGTFAPICLTAILDRRNLATSPEARGNSTNGMAMSRAPSAPHGPFRAKAAKTTPTTEAPHDAHVAMRRFVAAL